MTEAKISKSCCTDAVNEGAKEKPVYFHSVFGVYQQRLMYSNIFFIGALHILGVYFIFTYPFIKEWRTTIFNFIVGSAAGVGITGAVHRYYTHRSFKAKRPLVFMFLILYAMAGHNKIFDWVRDHRVHHKFTETDADPHNSKRGFFFAHVGWLMMKKHPDVYRKGKMVDMSDIVNDPLVQWYDRHFVLMKTIFCFTLPIIIPVLMWESPWYYSIAATILRYIIVLNNTWLVNSAAHIYGYKPYDKRIKPADNFFVSVLSLGEGWHNYHHTFPWDYRASELGQFNPTTHFLNFMVKIGWCYDAKYPSDELIRKIALKYGDGSYSSCTNVTVDENEKISTSCDHE